MLGINSTSRPKKRVLKKHITCTDFEESPIFLQNYQEEFWEDTPFFGRVHLLNCLKNDYHFKPSRNDEPKNPHNLITSTFFPKKDDFVECFKPQLSGGVFPTFWALPPRKWSTKTTPEDLEPENTPQRKIETDHHLQVLYLRGWIQFKKVANVKWVVYLFFPIPEKKTWTFSGPTVDGRNPAPVDLVNIPFFTGFLYIPGGWEGDFFH